MKNRKLSLEFTKTEDGEKNAVWSDESAGRVRIWHKQHEKMGLSYLVSTVYTAGGVMMQERFSWDSLTPLLPNENHLNVVAYLSIAAEHVHTFMTTM